MKIEDDGILIGLRPLGERDFVARIFSREYGIVSGVMKGGQIAKKNKPLIGQVGKFAWNARLDSQLGAFHWESEKNLIATFLLDMQVLAFVNAAFDLLLTLLPEREKYDALFGSLITLLTNMNKENSKDIYLNWELDLLRELGYALDLSKCSNCGTHFNLNYLSPRTGRAVCDDCAKPYLSKVYPLPLSLDITFRFLDNVCEQQGVQMPITRKMLLGF